MTSTEPLWYTSGLSLQRQLHAAGIEVLRPAAYETGSFNVATLREIKRNGIRSLMLLAYDPDMTAIAEKAALETMTGEFGQGWTWTLTEGHLSPTNLMTGWLHVQSFLPSDGMQAFAKRVRDYTLSHFDITISADSVDLTYSATLHDAVMLYALAATKVLSEGGDVRDGLAVTKAVRNTTFKGVGGVVVALDSQGDRIESYQVMSYVLGADGGMDSVAVGVYNSSMGQYRAYETEVVWPGGTADVPVSYVSGALPDCIQPCIDKGLLL